jgi:hypothetical protein
MLDALAADIEQFIGPVYVTAAIVRSFVLLPNQPIKSGAMCPMPTVNQKSVNIIINHQ